MISMFEQGSQICQLHLDTFPGNSAAQKKTAFDLMVELAMAYTSDSIKRTELLKVRGDKVEALGLSRPRRGRRAAPSLKRPAAAHPAPPSCEDPGAAAGGGALPVARAAKKARLAIRRRPAADAARAVQDHVDHMYV
jgi:hypothetical protein